MQFNYNLFKMQFNYNANINCQIKWMYSDTP